MSPAEFWSVSMNILNFSLLIFLIFSPSIVFGSGFQIPNQSVVAMGISGAHIAYTPGPDAAYYNPANMNFLADAWEIEGTLTSLYLSSIDYTDNRSPLLNGLPIRNCFFYRKFISPQRLTIISDSAFP